MYVKWSSEETKKNKSATDIFFFTDVDECSFSPSLFTSCADCENTIGSYRCSCRPGFLDNATASYRKKYLDF